MKTNIRVILLFLFAAASVFAAGCDSESIANGAAVDPYAKPFVNNKQQTPKKKEKTTITISAVGDMMIGSPFPSNDRMPPNDGKDMFNLVKPLISRADIAFGNLEGSFFDSGRSAKCKPKSTKCYAFRMPTRYGQYFKDAGFDVLSAANNHAGDFGAAGRETTREILDGLGIKHAGSDRGQFSTAYLKVNDKTVAFIGFATNSISLNVNDLTSARLAVKDADARADLVVVSFHGGAEGTVAQRVPHKTEMFYGERRGNLRLFSKTVVDAGADLVIGHGPHVLRGMEFYKGRLIAYSMGNFATYGWFKLIGATRLTAILEVELDESGEYVSGSIHSGKQIDWGVPALDSSGEAVRKIRSLSNADFGQSAPLISDDGTLSKRLTAGQ